MEKRKARRRPGSRDSEKHRRIMELIKAGGSDGVFAADVSRAMGMRSPSYLFTFLNGEDPVAQDEVIYYAINRNGRKTRYKRTKLYYCDDEFYQSTEEKIRAKKARGAD